MNSSKTVWNKINHNLNHSSLIFSFPGGANGEEPTCQCRRLKRHGFNPRIRKIPAGGHGNQLQYSSLGISWTEEPGRLQSTAAQRVGHACTQCKYEDYVLQASRSVVSDSLQPHGLQHARPPCPSPTPGVYT